MVDPMEQERKTRAGHLLRIWSWMCTGLMLFFLGSTVISVILIMRNSAASDHGQLPSVFPLVVDAVRFSLVGWRMVYIRFLGSRMRSLLNEINHSMTSVPGARWSGTKVKKLTIIVWLYVTIQSE